jgi:catechol 2,3-dioxygenase-like lactoylglutathione lyase family enzyme
VSRVSHMVLPVVDLQRSRDWYVGTLGFTVEREQEGVGRCGVCESTQDSVLGLWSRSLGSGRLYESPVG